jgi:hypothetical protein
MFSYAVDHLLGYSRYLLLILLPVLLGCAPMAMSEPTPLRLLSGELGLSKLQVNQSLMRRHRKGMDCPANSGSKKQVCVFTATSALPLSLAGRLITKIHYHFADDQLTQVTGYFAPDGEPDGYHERMQQRYGTPSDTSSQQLHWLNGAELLSLSADSIQLEKTPEK